MKIRLWELFVCVTIVCILGMMLRPSEFAIADGHFELSIKSINAEQLPANLLIAYCWNEVEMEHAKAHGAKSSEITFRPLRQTAEETFTINLPHSSKYENGKQLSHHEPKFVVIQYESSGKVHIRSFAVPEGRGDRAIQF